MNIFNSLGSNYDNSFVKLALRAKNDSTDSEKLKTFLANKYNGEVHLTYKGRDAIYLALLASHLPPQSKVVITGFTCIAVYDAVKQAGFIPVLLDIEGTSLNFTPKKLQETLASDSSIKAVIIQNTLGVPANINEFLSIRKKYPFILIEDMAHCVGGMYAGGKEMGTVGDMSVFSFSQDKAIDAVSGGALIIRNRDFQRFTPPPLQKRSGWDELLDRTYPFLTKMIRSTYPYLIGRLLHFIFSSFGILRKPVEQKNVLYSLTSWHSLLAKQAFEKNKEDVAHRQKIAQMYHQSIDKEVQSKYVSEHILTTSNLRFPIFVEKRASLFSYLKGQGIHVEDTWYDSPISPKKYLKELNYEVILPNAQKISQTIVNLPTHKNISTRYALQISEHINQWLKQSK